MFRAGPENGPIGLRQGASAWAANVRDEALACGPVSLIPAVVVTSSPRITSRAKLPHTLQGGRSIARIARSTSTRAPATTRALRPKSGLLSGAMSVRIVVLGVPCTRPLNGANPGMIASQRRHIEHVLSTVTSTRAAARSRLAAFLRKIWSRPDILPGAGGTRYRGLGRQTRDAGPCSLSGRTEIG